MKLSDISVVRDLQFERRALLGALSAGRCTVRLPVRRSPIEDPFGLGIAPADLSIQAWPLARAWLTKRIAEIERTLAELGVSLD